MRETQRSGPQRPDRPAWDEPVLDVAQLLLDRQIVDVDGLPVAKVDDLELQRQPDGGPPVVTAILYGPTALGPRIGGRLGTLWVAVGRRFRPVSDIATPSIPFDAVAELSTTRLQLSIPVEDMAADRFSDWVREKVVFRLPGGRR
jgi:hypothetical protein